MKNLLTLFALFLIGGLHAQFFSGEVYMRDNSDLYLNEVYVTNLTTQNTVIAAYDGSFRLPAKAGDAVRFTSIAADRKDVTVIPAMLDSRLNLIELKVAYTDIQEVVLKPFRPSGNLRKDVATLKIKNSKLEIEKRIGLPEPKGDGNPPQQPIAGFSGGGFSLSVDAIYDMLSGEKVKKERLYKYMKLQQQVSDIRKFYGDDYFIKLKIPKNMIANFLEFVCTSENTDSYLKNNTFDALQPIIEKYLPVYAKRLQNSGLPH